MNTIKNQPAISAGALHEPAGLFDAKLAEATEAVKRLNAQRTTLFNGFPLCGSPKERLAYYQQQLHALGKSPTQRLLESLTRPSKEFDFADFVTF